MSVGQAAMIVLMTAALSIVWVLRRALDRWLNVLIAEMSASRRELARHRAVVEKIIKEAAPVPPPVKEKTRAPHV